MNGATLRAIRTTCGYTLDHFANLVKVAGRTLSRWELDARDVPADVAFKADEILDDYLDLIDNTLPTLDRIGDGPYAFRADDGAPDGYDRVLWNAAVFAWALRENRTVMWLGDEDTEVEG